jgi:hypothetical protein
MTAPLPSTVRVVRIYRGLQALVTRGIVPFSPLAWPELHPASTDPCWIDATGWLADIGDTLGTVTPSIVTTDGALTLGQTYVSSDSLQWGTSFGGPPTPGQTYVVRVLLYGAATGLCLGVDITLTILTVPVVENTSLTGFSVDGVVLTVNSQPLTP